MASGPSHTHLISSASAGTSSHDLSGKSSSSRAPRRNRSISTLEGSDVTPPTPPETTLEGSDVTPVTAPPSSKLLSRARAKARALPGCVACSMLAFGVIKPNSTINYGWLAGDVAPARPA
jgi:hypothetical protein